MGRLMDQVLGPSLEPFVFVYLDGIIILSNDFSTHLKVLREFFERLKFTNLTINLKKCEFCQPSLNYLGFIVNSQGPQTDSSKIEAIINYPIPNNTTQVKRLLGLVEWNRKFIKDFSSLYAPITDLLHVRKKGQSIYWTPEAEKVFQDIKIRLTTAPVLETPDFSKPFIIQCDASDVGLGAVLYQREDRIEHPIAYASKVLNTCQRKYSTTEKELLAVTASIETFRKYVEGTHFVVETDHVSLVWIHNF